MRDLKIRFGVMLALALFPLLLFSILSSYNDYQENIRLRSALLDDAAVTTTSEVINTIDNTKSILSLVVDAVTPETCDRSVRDVLDNFPIIYNVAIVGSDTGIMCAGTPLRTRAPLERALARISPESPIDVSIANVAQHTPGQPETLVVVSVGVYEDDSFKRMVRAAIDVRNLDSLRDRSLLPDDVLVSLYSETSDVVLGPRRENIEINNDWTDIARVEGRYQGSHTSLSGEPRQLIILPTTEHEIFIAISLAERATINPSQISPTLTAIIPIFAWLLGTAVIWFAAERLILTHLTTMRRSLTSFGQGHGDTRVQLPANTSSAIEDFGGSINRLMERVQTRESELETSVEEKETLLREIHHRVKNNLQIIISLLNMQERKLTDPRGLNAIKEIKHRINAIALLHKALYEGEDVSSIPMPDFLRQLATQLGRALVTDRKDIIIKTEIACRPLDTDRATPIALFIVEAVTNSVKHGVKDGGDILIKVIDQYGIITAQVIDNGQGLIQDTQSKPGTGSKLMQGFARQLSGKYQTRHNAPGFIAELCFPIEPE